MCIINIVFGGVWGGGAEMLMQAMVPVVDITVHTNLKMVYLYNFFF